MQDMREATESETGEKRSDAHLFLPSEDPTGDRSRRARRLAAPRMAMAVVTVTLVATFVAIALAGRSPLGAPVAVQLTPPQPELTIVPQLTPTAPPQPGPTATPIPLPLRREIEDAYDRFWRVRADAVLRLDPSRLPEVTAGEALERERREIAQLQAEGKAARIVVDLRYRIVKATDSTATVHDDLESRSYFVDPKTLEPIGPVPQTADLTKVSFDLEKVNGGWRVVDGTRFPS